MRSEVIRAGKYWFASLTTVTPITRNRCRIDVVAAWNLFRWMPFGASLLKLILAKFVEQDGRTMELQSEGLKHNPHLMLIDDADRPAKWYFELKIPGYAHQAHPAGIEQHVEGGHEIRDVGQYAEGREA